jgi:riboflavin biosynthesis pyrimidine reductase
MEIQRVLVEGGPVTIKHFLNAKLVDEFYLVQSEVVHQKPYSSGISAQVLDDAGLQHNSDLLWGKDAVQLFNRL